jgi:predicted Zn finger-like uncharacterized protein
MAIELNCPSCQTRMRVADSAAGKKARCPQCQAICEIPPPEPSGSTPLSSPLEAPLSPLTPLSSSLPSSPFDPPAKPEPESRPNPFSDASPFGGAGQAPLNPYASPAYGGGLANVPLTTEQVRLKLLGPAIGIVVGAIFCLAYAVFNAVVLVVGRVNLPNANDDMSYYLGMFFGATMIFLPSVGMLVGSIALFRGQPKWLAWVAVISSVLPCNPCCFINLGFGIWGIVVLCDPRVSQAMQ